MAGALPGGAFLGAQRLTVKPSWCTAPMCFHRLGVFPVLRELGIVRIGTNHPCCFFHNSHPEGVEGLVTYRDFSLDGKAQPLHVLCVVDRAFVWGGQLFQGYHPMVDALCSTHAISGRKPHAENPASMGFFILEPKFNIAPKKLPSLKESRLPTIILGASC